jgi:hypothetical protein
MEEQNTNDAAATYVTQIAGRNFLVDSEANRIAFLDSRFYRTPSGGFVPSVTTILEAYPKGAQFYEWIKKRGEGSYQDTTITIGGLTDDNIKDLVNAVRDYFGPDRV